MNTQTFQQNGYLVIENFMPNHVCDLLRHRATELIDEFDPTEVSTIFSSKNQTHAKDTYFLESGNKIRFFFEAGAFDADGELTTEKHLSINKIGHALHQLDPAFYAASRSHQHINLLQELGLPNPNIVQSMYLCKQPFIGDEVTCHQDATYLFAEKGTVTGLWFALEDATIDNGCLWAIPGGHNSQLKTRFRRDGNTMRTEVYDDTPWDLKQMVPLEVKKGTVIALHGLLPHMSYENKSASSRHAYALHVVDESAEFAKDNWLQL